MAEPDVHQASGKKEEEKTAVSTFSYMMQATSRDAPFFLCSEARNLLSSSMLLIVYPEARKLLSSFMLLIVYPAINSVP